ncbi:hypothetical protein [Magnetospira sp. QH-2]|uniref:hypothetical protein n=1 Tax=Magnetospira sp. (strain QH-2) TaxID=1288970 RepID=UPI0003E8194D|nr:hypothetical protein [Magnetospira sp. QH-2]CCQ74041.1 Protein of unknown function [Magnetospira sp. QH-2]
MYQPPNGELRAFDVRFVNTTVREKLANHESHSLYEDRWGETQVLRINADSADEARAKITRRYPAEQGFVVEAVQEAAN